MEAYFPILVVSSSHLIFDRINSKRCLYADINNMQYAYKINSWQGWVVGFGQPI
jgi:hypothetical protein